MRYIVTRLVDHRNRVKRALEQKIDKAKRAEEKSAEEERAKTQAEAARVAATLSNKVPKGNDVF